MSQYLNTGNQRAWWFARNGSNIEFRYSTDGSATSILQRAFTWSINTWYHVAVTRIGPFVRLFVDGDQIGGTFNIGSADIFQSTAVFYLGKIRSAGFDDLPFDGHIDDVVIHRGVGLYDGNFNAPVRAWPVNGNGTVIRSFTGLTSPSVTYTVAQQTTDFGGIAKNVLVDVYQISQSVGRGRSRLLRLEE